MINHLQEKTPLVEPVEHIPEILHIKLMGQQQESEPVSLYCLVYCVFVHTF